MFSDVLRLDIPGIPPHGICAQCEQPRPIELTADGRFRKHNTKEPSRHREVMYACEGAGLTPRESAVKYVRAVLSTPLPTEGETQRAIRLIGEHKIYESELAGIEIE